MYIYPQKYNVIVVGAGHAGVEAALSTAQMGVRTLILTMNLDTIAQMSCNPAIGGIAKGQIVREIDALGGEMAKTTDKTGIQFRMLNRSKGPAVQSPRAQCDRKLYQFTMKRILEQTPNLDLRQEEVTSLYIENSQLRGVVTKYNTVYKSDTVILTTGTFLNGLLHIGLDNFTGGRYNEPASTGISPTLRELGFTVGRLKTGTPPRINGRTVDFSKLTAQYGDNPPVPFSHFSTSIPLPQVPCWLTYTNDKTAEIIRSGLDRSPLYTGKIKSIGPRYCPSIEDKIVRFPERDRHQMFLEPEGLNTEEFYCNGISTSLPIDVQEQIVHSIEGCETAQITRYGYAVEYDYCPPTQLHPNLETKLIDRLFFAGQINGTTGYEEAAGQGLIAGINAVLKLREQTPFILGRDEAYLGVLIDDLVTKGVMDPYRMFTSRAEYRLLLRNDNADLRLLEYGYRFGLVSMEMYDRFGKYKELVETELVRLENTIDPQENVSLAQLIRQGKPLPSPVSPLPSTPDFLESDLTPWTLDKVKAEVEIQIKYDGYIKRELQQVTKIKKLDSKKIPSGFDYDTIPGLLKESQVKLKQIQPISIGQASRISGVTPADISILLIWLEKHHRSIIKV